MSRFHDADGLLLREPLSQRRGRRPSAVVRTKSGRASESRFAKAVDAFVHPAAQRRFRLLCSLGVARDDAAWYALDPAVETPLGLLRALGKLSARQARAAFLLRKATTQTRHDSREDRSIERITLGTTVDCGRQLIAVEPEDAWDVASDVAEPESDEPDDDREMPSDDAEVELSEADVTSQGGDAPETETYEMDIAAVRGGSAIGVQTLGQAARAMAVHGSTPALVMVVVCGAVRHECGADAWRLLDGLLRDGPVPAGANLAMLRGALDVAASYLERLDWQIGASPRQLFGPERRAVAMDGAGTYGAFTRSTVSPRAALAAGYHCDMPISAASINSLLESSDGEPFMLNHV